MGLTINFSLQGPAGLDAATAERLVHEAHRRASALVCSRGLRGIGPARPVDPEQVGCCRFVFEKLSEHESRGHEVPPERGWHFSVHPGEDCESVGMGLGQYPAIVRVGRRTFQTGCVGWSWSGFCKTQYASLHGPEHFLKCHRAVIDLLLIWQRLGVALTINDEGGYWPGRRTMELNKKLGEMNRVVAAMAGALKDASGDSAPKVRSPIFAHPQFERLEAEGVARHGTKISGAVKAVRASLPTNET